MTSGAKWASEVIQDKLNKGNLPNIGKGYSDRYRAAYAVRGIASNKLRVRHHGVTQDLPLPHTKRQFWSEVEAYASSILCEEN